MNAAPLLIEILTEELPPKALKKLGDAFSRAVLQALAERKLCAANVAFRAFATPRRLGILLDDVLEQAPEQPFSLRIMPVAIAYDKSGEPTPALLKSLQAKGLPTEGARDLERRTDGKAEMVYASGVAPGVELSAEVGAVIEQALKALPIPKVMRWGDSDAEFVRPVHGIVVMHGSQVLDATVLGLTSVGVTRGHRFMSEGELAIDEAGQYEVLMEAKGRVIADYAKRRTLIQQGLTALAGDLQVAADEALLDEVTALVEYPAVYAGAFDARFLAVPSEVLILSMKQHQKYFPLLDANGKLAPRFLFVSNIATDDPSHIIAGNERVLRARLSDAAFFFEQDKKTPLADRVGRLADVVYHNKLGTQLQRIERIQALAVYIATEMGVNAEAVRQAAYLCKADLVTEMVGEFPELQGTMGYYYALNDGVSEEVALAIKEHYQPRFSGDATPTSLTGLFVALADKLDTLVGMFGIGVVPTGDKDPFALRRQAYGAVLVVAELFADAQKVNQMVGDKPLELAAVIRRAIEGFPMALAPDTAVNVRAFILERLRHELVASACPANVIQAVFELDLDVIPDIYARVSAVRDFTAMPEAEALAAANKRIKNILRKAEVDKAAPVAPALFQEEAERALFTALETLTPLVEAHSAQRRYTDALQVLAGIRPEVDAFFDQVMVMADESALRQNRLALLQRLNKVMNQVADISRLAV